MWELILLALALMFVIEGIFPFINPQAYKKFMLQFTKMSDNSLRRVGLSMMVIGAVSIFILKS